MSAFYVTNSKPPLGYYFSQKINNFTFFKVTHIFQIIASIIHKAYCITWLNKTLEFSPQNYMSQYLNVTDILPKSINIKTCRKIPKIFS